MHAVYLGLGSNLGDRKANLRRALDLLSAQLPIEAVSGLYETDPWGYEGQPPFLNAVCRCVTDIPPEKLLASAKRIETELGREPGPRYGPRTLDIDLLLYGTAVHESPDLVLPHPRLAERPFVLVPLAEIAPEALHPIQGRTIAQLLSDVGQTEGVRLAEKRGWWREGR